MITILETETAEARMEKIRLVAAQITTTIMNGTLIKTIISGHQVKTIMTTLHITTTITTIMTTNITTTTTMMMFPPIPHLPITMILDLRTRTVMIEVLQMLNSRGLAYDVIDIKATE